MSQTAGGQERYPILGAQTQLANRWQTPDEQVAHSGRSQVEAASSKWKNGASPAWCTSCLTFGVVAWFQVL